MAERTKKQRRMFFIGGGIIIILVILYFAFLYPPPSAEDVKGTIGGAQKAQRWRAQQISDSDVVLDNPELQSFMQSAEVQNLMKNFFYL